MEQSRQRSEEDVIIVGNRSNLRFIVDVILTLFFWAYSILVIAFFVSAIVGYSNPFSRILNMSFKTTNSQVRILLLIGVIFFCSFYLLLRINRFYNKKRFGSLARRNYPTPVTNQDLNALELMNEETIERLQTEDYIIFEENPIISLKKEKHS